MLIYEGNDYTEKYYFYKYAVENRLDWFDYASMVGVVYSKN